MKKLVAVLVMVFSMVAWADDHEEAMAPEAAEMEAPAPKAKATKKKAKKSAKVVKKAKAAPKPPPPPEPAADEEPADLPAEGGDSEAMDM
jgi:hypothetical protein